jgi:Protoglobin
MVFRTDGKPDETYKAAVKRRFVQWVIDTCTRRRDQAWLDYQEEIGLRHTGQEEQDRGSAHSRCCTITVSFGLHGTSDYWRQTFLVRKGHSPVEIEKMHQAWTKAVLLEIALWNRPYAQHDLWQSIWRKP